MPHALALPPTGLPTPQFEMLNAELEENCKAKIQEAEEKAAQIIADAETKAQAQIAAASHAIQQYMQAHPQAQLALSNQEDSDAR